VNFAGTIQFGERYSVIGSMQVAREVHLPDDLGPRQAVGLGERPDPVVELVLRDRLEVTEDHLRECPATGAGDDAYLRLAEVRHGS
jgi:hypothetical protein